LIVAEKIANINNAVIKTNLKHIAIIMDGNRRWAKEKGLPSAVGHKKGVEALKSTVKACHKAGVQYLTVYAFSTENWNRKQEEVDFLMNLLAHTIKNELKELYENNVKISFIGDIAALNPSLQKILEDSEEKTAKNTGLNLQIAINYGARNEITNAVKNIIAQGFKPEEITEELISKNIYTKNMPDPDLLIRTGGEMRISNYLLWQIAYAEIYVTKTFWPDFGEDALFEAIESFIQRQRRWGG